MKNAGKSGLVYFLMLLAIFVYLKYWHSLVGTAELYFLLWPVSFLLELTTNAPASYDSEFGFVFEGLGIVLDRSCSGFNFLLICFLMLGFSVLPQWIDGASRVLMIPLLLLFAYLACVVANFSRVMLLLKLPVSWELRWEWLHAGIGAGVYLSTLMLIFLFFTQMKSERQP